MPVLAAALVLSFAGLAVGVPAAGGFGWDVAVAEAVEATAPVSSSEVHIDPVLTTTSFALGGLTVLFGLVLLARRRLRGALFLLLAIGGAVVLSSLAKALVQRPAIEGDPDAYTFPSGTATWSLVTVVSLAALARTDTARRLIAAAGALIVVGFAWVIVWEEWHYPSDVLAGWCLGLAWVSALWLVLRPREPSALG